MNMKMPMPQAGRSVVRPRRTDERKFADARLTDDQFSCFVRISSVRRETVEEKAVVIERRVRMNP